MPVVYDSPIGPTLDGGGLDFPAADGGSWFDGISDFWTGAMGGLEGLLGGWMDFEGFKLQRDASRAQIDAQKARAQAEARRLGGTGSLDMGSLMTIALVVVGGVLVWKAVK